MPRNALIPPDGQPVPRVRRVRHLRPRAYGEIQIPVVIQVGQLERGVTRRAGLQCMPDKDAWLRLLQVSVSEIIDARSVAISDGSLSGEREVEVPVACRSLEPRRA
jgi:hypothetical protein